MTTITMSTIERHYANFGQHAEQTLAFTLTGEIRKHDHVAYTAGSDIPEYHMSVKSAKFSLMNGNLCESQDFDGIVNEFFAKTASKCFAYVTQDMECFVMTPKSSVALCVNSAVCPESQPKMAVGAKFKCEAKVKRFWSG